METENAAERATRIYQENVRETRAHFAKLRRKLRNEYLANESLDIMAYNAQQAALRAQLDRFLRAEADLYRLNRVVAMEGV